MVMVMVTTKVVLIWMTVMVMIKFKIKIVKQFLLQDMDEQRVKCIQTFMRKSAQTEQVNTLMA